ncbi:tryptophan-rich sensory protein [Clostridium bowmanii]|uniref:tryptophan-rich sensory protein n=1 Tax=Clostridium bowmanii TaxID=132925 RepID=UPI001C0DA2BB|nr:tryptophan-rich sensory protein [Clostridium bowmanii]MBU3191727.1 tryptophan-rich sensory protein [Clostridium bowmanii]MCA1076040.1 tryptophan-rich sensory protein [Clostridium bowmanii]
MRENKTKISIKVFVGVTFIVMVAINALANILPINGQTTGGVSDFYKNLFAPAGITFAIWGLIYFELAAYTIYQAGLFQNNKSKSSVDLLEKIGVYFSISSIANSIWIFSWHYRYILLSTLLMVVILVCLIIINQIIKRENLSFKEKFFIKFPFSIYFGWITVATIANVTTLLVSLGWDGLGISEPIWTVIIISVGLIIGITTILKNRDIAYGFVLIWAYAGILIKHVSPSGFSNQYMEVITTVIVSIVLLMIAEIYIFSKNRMTI